VGSVLRRRVQDRRWPDTYNDVALQPAQFSCFNAGDPNFEKLMNPETYEKHEVIQQLHWVANGIVYGLLLDNVAGANHYYDFSIIAGQGQQYNPERLHRYIQAVDLILAPRATVIHVADQVEQAKDLIHTLVAPLPPKWDDEVLPIGRKGWLVFFKL